MRLPVLAGPRRRTCRALLAAVLPATLVACALPAAASAATISIGDDTLFYQGGSERNSLSIREVAGALVVSDPAGVSNVFTAPPLPPPPCASVDSRTLRCPLVKRVVARMAGGDDTAASINTRIPVVIDGGTGQDRYIAGNSPFSSRVEFRGGGNSGTFGGGSDTADYTSADRGVRVSNDGVANDGRIGLDQDNIGHDVEKLTGSRFVDELTAAGGGPDQLCCSMILTGGEGDDVLRAGSGSIQAVFNMGPVADGADRIFGGQRRSIVDYSERTRPVNVTLNFGGADDGEAGEGDEIIGGNEMVVGGEADDTIRAPAGSTAAHSLFGSGGIDTLEGADGPDRLHGGSRRDTLRAGGGSDTVFAVDGETDVIDCGEDRDGTDIDTVSVDNIDLFTSCENRSVGVLRLAPHTMRADAGKVARMRLSWRHPDDWRKLRTIELRLLSADGLPVGEVTVRPRAQRITDDGAVHLVRRASRLTRKGKTVTARLAVRLDESVAGQKLGVEVEATDTRGRRQLERDAGSIRVAE